MGKQKLPAGLRQQINQYDKILQENIESALPGLIKNVLHINAVESEELPDSIQHTKERKPDLLKKITDDKGDFFVLHIEFQTRNDPDMPARPAVRTGHTVCLNTLLCCCAGTNCRLNNM